MVRVAIRENDSSYKATATTGATMLFARAAVPGVLIEVAAAA